MVLFFRPGRDPVSSILTLQYTDDINVWGNTAEEGFEKGEKVIQVLLKASFAIKQTKVKGPAGKFSFQE